MKRVIGLGLLGAVALWGSAAGAGVTATVPPTQGAALLVADTSDFATTRDEYLRKARTEFQSWQDRMSQWTDTAKANGNALGDDAHRNLDKAWVDVKANWRKLQAAAPQGWEKAREAFESASQRLKSAWTKVEPQG